MTADVCSYCFIAWSLPVQLVSCILFVSVIHKILVYLLVSTLSSPFSKSACSAILISNLFHVLICLICSFFLLLLYLISSPAPSYTLLICCRHSCRYCNPPCHPIFCLINHLYFFPPRPFHLMFSSSPSSLPLFYPAVSSLSASSQLQAQVRKRIISL